MDWIQFATFLIANGVFTLTLWLWSRSESRSDYRALRDTIESNARETRDLITAIKDEMTEFHGRLCAIEERNRR